MISNDGRVEMEQYEVPARRRIRHDARDALSVAGFSLTVSIGAAGLLWLLGWWLA